MELTDLPRRIEPDVYESTRQAIKRKYGNLPGVEAVIEWGTIPHPGISDMDCYVVVEPRTRVLLPSLKEYNVDQRYAMMHKHFVVSSNVFQLLHYSDPWMIHMKPLLGDAHRYTIPEQPFGEEERVALSLNFILSSGVLSFLQLAAEGAAKNELPVREFFEEAKYVEYHERELKRAGLLEEQESDPHISLYQSLRKEWFDWSEDEQHTKVEEAFHHWRHSLAHIIDILNAFLSQHAQMQPTPEEILKHKTSVHSCLLKSYPNSVILNCGNEIFVYQQDRTDTKIIVQEYRSPLTKSGRTQNTYLLPFSICAISNNHLTHDGAISSQYRKCVATDLDQIPVYSHPAITKLLDVMKQNVEDTKFVGRGKQPFVDYGLQIDAGWKVPLRSRLGGTYNRLLTYVTQKNIGKMLQKECKEVPLAGEKIG